MMKSAVPWRLAEFPAKVGIWLNAKTELGQGLVLQAVVIFHCLSCGCHTWFKFKFRR